VSSPLIADAVKRVLVRAGVNVSLWHKAEVYPSIFTAAKQSSAESNFHFQMAAARDRRISTHTGRTIFSKAIVRHPPSTSTAINHA